MTLQLIRALKQKIKSGDTEAANMLGYIYEQGLFNQPNYPAAVKQYKIASEQGSLLGKNNLAVCKWFGRGIKQDKEGAMTLWQEAAKKELPIAQYNYAAALIEQNQNSSAAITYLEKAAEAGEENSLYLLAQIYEQGEFPPRDLEKALYYYNLAEVHAHPLAREKVLACRREILASTGEDTAVFAPLFTSGRNDIIAVLRSVLSGENNSDSIFITGLPGSGKSYLLFYLMQESKRSNSKAKAQPLILYSNASLLGSTSELYLSALRELSTEFCKLSGKVIDTPSSPNKSTAKTFQEALVKAKEESFPCVWVIDSAESLVNIFNDTSEFIKFVSLFENKVQGIFLSRRNVHELEAVISPSQANLSRIVENYVLAQFSEEDIRSILIKWFKLECKEKSETEAEIIENAKTRNLDIVKNNLSELSNNLFFFTGGNSQILQLYLRELESNALKEDIAAEIGKIYSENSLEIHAFYDLYKNWLKELELEDRIKEIVFDPLQNYSRNDILDLINSNLLIPDEDESLITTVHLYATHGSSQLTTNCESIRYRKEL